MIPIRKGDGTGLSVPGFTEVRKGDGTVLWSAGADIPDSGLLHRYDAKEESEASSFTDLEGTNDLLSNGSPTLDSNGINGFQSMRYDGTDDEHTGSALNLGTNDEYTAAWVSEIVTLSGDGSTMWSNGGKNNGYRHRDDSSTNYNHPHNAIANNRYSGIDTDPHVFVATYDGTLTIDVDKTEKLNNSVGIDPPSGSFTFGSAGGVSFKNVYIGEYLHYDVYKSTTERDEISSYLANSWGITI